MWYKDGYKNFDQKRTLEWELQNEAYQKYKNKNEHLLSLKLFDSKQIVLKSK